MTSLPPTAPRDRRRTSVAVVRRRDIESGVDGSRQPGAHAVLRTSRARWIAAAGTYCVDTPDPVVAITYDDGPHPEHTPRILDVLAARGMHATFFTLAPAVEAYPEVARRIVADGHELALHGQDHRRLTGRPLREVRTTLRDARARIEDVAQVRLHLFRPPYGAMSARQAVAVWRAGLDPVIWSGDATDWVDDEVRGLVARGCSAIFPGAIVLLHDDRADPETLRPGERLPAFDKGAVLSGLADHLEACGYGTLTVSALTGAYPRVVSMARSSLLGR